MTLEVAVWLFKSTDEPIWPLPSNPKQGPPIACNAQSICLVVGCHKNVIFCCFFYSL